MCSKSLFGGGGGGTTVVQSPAVSEPPTVKVNDIGAGSASAEKEAMNKQRRKRGNSANAIAQDRGTILGGMANAENAFRQTLG